VRGLRQAAPSTASPLGMPFEFHEKCRIHFQQLYLQRLFVHAVSMARETVAAGTAQHGTDGDVCEAALQLMTSCLAWEFDGCSGSGGFGYTPDDARTATESTLVTPGVSWQQVLLAPEVADWALALQAALRGTSSTLLPPLRRLLVQLCSLGGDVLPEGAHGASARATHITRCYAVLRGWVGDVATTVAAAAAGQHAAEEDLLSAAAALCAMSTVHAPVELEQQQDGGAGAAALLAALVERCAAAGGLRTEAEGTWLEQVLDVCLDAWVALLQVRVAVVSSSVSVRFDAAVDDDMGVKCWWQPCAGLQVALDEMFVHVCRYHLNIACLTCITLRCPAIPHLTTRLYWPLLFSRKAPIAAYLLNGHTIGWALHSRRRWRGHRGHQGAAARQWRHPPVCGRVHSESLSTTCVRRWRQRRRRHWMMSNMMIPRAPPPLSNATLVLQAWRCASVCLSVLTCPALCAMRLLCSHKWLAHDVLGQWTVVDSEIGQRP
jgi:hypothetical protein